MSEFGSLGKSAGETAELQAEVERLTESGQNWHRSAVANAAECLRAEHRAEAAEAESARLVSERRELAAQVAGLRSVVAVVEALADKWKNTPGAFVQHGSVLSSAWREASLSLDAAIASVAPDTATPGEADGAALIAAERQRQIDAEGYTPEHDADHKMSQFVATAVSYLGGGWSNIGQAWPIKRATGRVGDGYYQRRDLVKAGALIAAAIDRLDQIEAQR
jgi:hypothetical protein